MQVWEFEDEANQSHQKKTKQTPFDKENFIQIFCVKPKRHKSNAFCLKKVVKEMRKKDKYKYNNKQTHTHTQTGTHINFSSTKLSMGSKFKA